MNYWEITYYTGEGEFETKSVIVSDEEYRQVQKVIRDGGSMVLLKDRPSFKVSLIASVNKANHIVNEHIKTGMPIYGVLPENSKMPLLGETQEERKKKGFKQFNEWAEKQEWYKKWKEKNPQGNKDIGL